MLQALLDGKLSSSQANMEDVLTSCVFGCFKYDEPNDGLGIFLRAARGSNQDDRPLEALDIHKAKYIFWPAWNVDGLSNCEPDVVLEIETRDNRRLMVLVEVKFRSGKSAYADEASDAPTDQLAKEWDHLVKKAIEQESDPVLLYVTSNALFPGDDISAAGREYKKKRLNSANYRPFRCHWISWRSLFQMFNGRNGPIATDLSALAKKLSFKEFDGYGFSGCVGPVNWAYSVAYNWRGFEITTVEWNYQQSRQTA